MVAGLLVVQTAPAEENGPQFEVTVTNLTRGQTFTPVLVASHREGVTLFTLGAPASSQLAILAEEGNTAPLAALLLAPPGARRCRFGRATGGLRQPRSVEDGCGGRRSWR